MNSSRLSLWCDRALETGWLLGVTITPVFFNVYSSRVFEPDKLTTLRALATVMAVLWLVRWLDGLLHKEKLITFSWRTPLVLPALLMMVVYLISSIFSLVPYTSFVGSYQRLQGFYSLMGYLVLFFAILSGLRTRVQLSRLLTVLILNGLPIALYGIIQHNGLDPLPWAGDVQTRVASNMGNPIFVAAYLIMIIPLTAARIVESFRDILGREEARVSDILRASGYIFVLAVEVLGWWYAQSRGPILGLIAAGFMFPLLALLILQRQALAKETERRSWLMDTARGIAFGVGTLLLAGAILALGVLVFQGNIGLYLGGFLAALVFGAAWLYFIVERKGWQWLWIGWGAVGLSVAMALLAINIPGPLQTRAQQIHTLNRLANITELESGSGKVRTLIWQGAIELIKPHAPITFPDGSTDKFNAIRLLVGYGPESMYVSYNNFYPPDLGHYESRTASPDRSHNETLDSLANTGLLGLLAYLFVFGSVFYWGFRWLGLLKSRQQLLIYLGLDIFFFLVFFFIGWRVAGLYLFAVAVPLGILVGTVAYLVLEGFRGAIRGREAAAGSQLHPHTILIVAILAAVIGHLVEINFGIAIASTRTTFWALAGLLVVLGLEWLPGENSIKSAKELPAPTTVGQSQRRRKRHEELPVPFPVPTQQWLYAVLALCLLSTFLLGTLSYDFINNPGRLSDAGKIFWNSLTQLYVQQRTSYGGLLIFIFTWIMFGMIGLSELDREGLFEEQRGQRWGTAVLAYVGITLLGWLLFGSLLAAHQGRLVSIPVTSIPDVVAVAVRLANILGYYYLFIFLLVTVNGLLLMREAPSLKWWGDPISAGVLVVALLMAGVLIRYGCYDLIRADIVFKQGGVYADAANAAQKQIGIAHYEKAIELAPREDYYYLFRGKAYLELAQMVEDAQTREAVMVRTEEVLQQAREINPLNTDHSANLGRFYRSWAGQTTDSALRAERLQKSLENYKTALVLSPHNVILWNELGILYAFDLQDSLSFQQTISHSLELDSRFDQTWMLLGDVRSSQGDVAGAMAAYQEALDISPINCNVRRVLGTMQAQQGLWNESVATLERAVEDCANVAELWDVYRVLAIGYANQGRGPEAFQVANQALTLAPDDQKSTVQQLLDALQGQSIQPTPQPTPQP